LFEAGYFTVTDVRELDTKNTKEVRLGIPNEQIRNLLNSDYISSVIPNFKTQSTDYLNASAALRRGDILDLFKCMQSQLSSVPFNHMNLFASESAFLVFTINYLSSLNAEFTCEEPSSRGRSDILLFSNGKIFIIELKALDASGDLEKLTKSCNVALNQISDSGYADSQFVKFRESPSRDNVVECALVTDTNKNFRCFAMFATKDPITGKIKHFPIKSNTPTDPPEL